MIEERNRVRDAPSDDRRKIWAGWALFVLASVITLIGAVMAAGGIWLISLGGSWYYLLAGAAFLAAGVLLIVGRIGGVWLYLAVCAATVIWAVWEVGFDVWELLPRVLVPAVLAVAVLFFIPFLRRRRRS